MARLTVALCTYNGATYLPCQLESILRQTRLPDELVVSDDGSRDGTLELLKDFRATAPFDVRLEVNSQRLGPAQNFGRVVQMASGDLIALCDQDDQWLPTKLAQAEARFLAEPNIEAVFSDGIVVNSILKPMGYTLWQHVGMSKADRRLMMTGRGLSVVVRHATVTGATLTIRASLLKRALPIPRGWMHDAWFALMAAAANALYAIPSPLILYRQHDANEIGARRVSLFRRWRQTIEMDREAYYGDEITRYRAAIYRLEECCDDVSPDSIKIVRAKLRHLETRACLPMSRVNRIIPIFRELARLGYRRYSFGWKVAVKDFLLPGNPT